MKMKRIWVALLSAGMVFGMGSCMKEDLDNIRQELQEHDDRLASLEEWQESVNTDISSLQSLVEALEDNDYVTGVTPLADGSGYEITFSKSGKIIVKHGDTGDTGDTGATPAISVKQDTDGKYYWTVDGEWLLDGDRKIPVTGPKGEDGDAGASAIAPQVRINAGTNEWEISTDGGATWTSTGVQATGEKGDDGDSFFQGVTVFEDDGYVSIELKDGQTFQIPFSANRLTFVLGGTRLTDLTQVIDVSAGDLTYAVTGSGEVAARILEGDGWSVQVVEQDIRITGKIGGTALLELTLMENGKVMEIYRLNLTQSSFIGKGTSEAPYTISMVEELSYLAEQVNNGTAYADQYFQLTQSIDLSGVEMEPIGTVRTGAVALGKAFRGIFDGKSHTISNLNMTTTDEKLAQGLFGYNLGTIKNLTLENVSIKGYASQGALAGDNRGTIENCHVTGTVTVEGSNNVGGLVGNNYGNNNTSPATVINCSVSGNVTVKGTGVINGIGGIIGYNGTGRVTACRFQGTVSVSNSTYCSMGGIVGYSAVIMKTDESSVTACYANCKFENASYYPGGVVGTSDDFGTNKVVACYAIVAASNGLNVGGVCGSAGEFITSCYWKKSGDGTYPQYGIDNFYDSYYNPDIISNENATPVSGEDWSSVMNDMNTALAGTGWEYRVNDGSDSGVFPLVIEKVQ